MRGVGLEIGALHEPFPLPAGVRVSFVDRWPGPELARRHPEIDARAIVPVEIVDDGETLASQPDASRDFVVASHVLEHCEDPLGALATWLRVVRPGGSVLLAVPDRRHTFDRRRPPTPLAHVERDHAEGPGVSRAAHYEEWVVLVEGVAPEGAAARARELERARASIHFHVWDRDGLGELLRAFAARSGGGVGSVALRRNRSENLALVRRSRIAP